MEKLNVSKFKIYWFEIYADKGTIVKEDYKKISKVLGLEKWYRKRHFIREYIGNEKDVKLTLYNLRKLKLKKQYNVLKITELQVCKDIEPTDKQIANRIKIGIPY